MTFYVIYNVNTTAKVELQRYERPANTEKMAKSRLTRIVKKGKFKREDLAIAESKHYNQNIARMVERTNLMSGQKYMESINTPSYCSPASEAYWSM